MCVSRGHDRLARGRALRDGFELNRDYLYKLGFSGAVVAILLVLDYLIF
jgi:hypothetical protein